MSSCIVKLAMITSIMVNLSLGSNHAIACTIENAWDHSAFKDCRWVLKEFLFLVQFVKKIWKSRIFMEILKMVESLSHRNSPITKVMFKGSFLCSKIAFSVRLGTALCSGSERKVILSMWYVKLAQKLIVYYAREKATISLGLAKRNMKGCRKKKNEKLKS